jgi:putative YhdH/YhfP family quinone oxidoreductase
MNGNKGVTRHYPHTPGIDAAGIVVESSSLEYSKNDQVIVTGYDLGMNTSGGFSEYIRVPANWLVPCPKTLTSKESMIYGTAGFTAALSVNALIKAGIRKEDGDILVTGASGGVGIISLAILAKLGYSVYALSGKSEANELLLSIGAKDVLYRHELDDQSEKAMLKPRWAGVIDTVGGNILATALKTTQYGGCVTSCGNIAGDAFKTSVYPFILRGITLAGIDSVTCPMPLRKEIWNKLSQAWKPNKLDLLTEVISLKQINTYTELMLKGQSKGRKIVDLSK